MGLYIFVDVIEKFCLTNFNSKTVNRTSFAHWSRFFLDSDYRNINASQIQNVNSNLHPYREMGDGVYEALWKLTLAMFLKGIITVFTFGIKVRAV